MLSRRCCLASYCFRLCPTQVSQDVLFPLLQFKQNRGGHQPILVRTMHLAGRQEDALQIFDRCLRYLELLIIGNPTITTSTIPRRVKSFPVW